MSIEIRLSARRVVSLFYFLVVFGVVLGSASPTQAQDVTVSASGAQTATLAIPSTDQYLGGKFVIVDNTGSRNITGITFTESGAVNALSNLDNIKLFYELDTTAPYDGASESYAGSELQFGATDTDGFSAANGTSSFTDTVAINTTSTLVVYVVFDVGSGASAGETVQVSIEDPSSEVVASAGTVGPGTAVSISGTTILTAAGCGPVINYRSIGTQATPLANTGTASVALNGTVVNFSGVSLPANLGQGDRIFLDTGGVNEARFILSRESATQVTLQTPAQNNHSAGVAYLIERVYSGATPIRSWESGTQANLVSLNRRETGVAYNDGVFNDPGVVSINGATTDACHFRTLTVAVGQRHTGIEGTGVAIDGGAGLAFDDDYTVLEWFEIANVADALEIIGANLLFANLIIHDFGPSGFDTSGSSWSFIARNCLVYAGGSHGFSGGSTAAGPTATIENCTLYGNSGAGVDEGSGPVFTVRNTLSMGNSGLDFDIVAGTQDNNMSSDTTAQPVANRSKLPGDQFIDHLGTPPDFHLKATADAKDIGTDLSAFYINDIDDDSRPIGAGWDIGADEEGVAGPTLTLADHDVGQVADKFTSTASVTDVLFAFKLTRSGTVTVDNIRVSFTLGDVANGDVSNGELYRDVNNNGAFDSGTDTLLLGGVTPVAGVLAFNSLSEDPGAGTNYIVRATVINLIPLDTTTFSVGTADIDEVEGGITEVGSITSAVHTQDGIPDVTQGHYRWRNDDGAESVGGDTTEVSATGSTTTTVVGSYEALSGMSITPGAGDYLVWFSGTLWNDVTGTQLVSLFLDAGQITHTEREITTESSIPQTRFVTATHAYIPGVTAGQAINVQWQTSAGVATMLEHTLTVMKVNAADVTQITRTNALSTGPATDTLIEDMTLTPGAGDYLIWFSGSTANTANPSKNHVSLYVNGSQVTGTEREIDQEASLGDTFFPVATHARVTGVGGGQAIDARWRVDTGNATMSARTLTVYKINPADNFQASTDTDDGPFSATSYTQVSSMTLTPGAGDYLVWFSSSLVPNGTGGDTFDVSLFSGGSQVLESEREVWVEGSIDTAPFQSYPVASHAYVTGVGAADDIEVRWRRASGSGNATMHERTLVVQKIVIVSGATFAAAEDTKLTGLAKSTIKRIRFGVSNEGTGTSGPVTYELQVAETATCSSGTYATVPTAAGGHWQVIDSTFINDGEATSDISPGLTNDATTFNSGELKDAGNTTGSITLDSDEFTEIEFSVQALAAATGGGDYCFRLYDATNTQVLDTYTVYAEVQLAGGSLTLADHDAAQIADQFGATTPVTSELFRFRLSAAGTVTVDNIRVHFSTGAGVVNGDVTSGELYRDENNDGVIDGGDTPIQTGVTPTGGILSFTSLAESPGAGANYLVRATVANLMAGDVTTFSMGTVDVDEVESDVIESGSVGFAVHTADSVSGGDVYYSVGTSRATSTDLKTGTPSISISNGTATFSQAQTGNVGVGDEINYDVSSLAYIKSVLSQTQFVVHTANGGVPANVSGVTVNSIMRAFADLPTAEANSADASHLNNLDLTATGANAKLTWVLYDDGDFTGSATINGYTTDATHYLTLTVADASQVASGASQRHTGKASTGVLIDGQSATDGIAVMDDYTVVEWLDLMDHRVVGESAIKVQSASNVLLRGLIIRDANMAIKAESGTQFTVRNSVLYNSTEAVHDEGATVLIENCTVFGISLGDGAIKGTNYTVKNTISMNNVGEDFKDMPVGNLSYNISEDATASCGTCLPNRNFTDVPTASANFVVFTDLSGGSEDFHLKASPVNDAVNAGLNLSGSFTNDIDDETRGVAWDIGADEIAVTVNYRSIGTATDYLTSTVTTTNGSPVVTGDTTLWLTNNRGRGDAITIPCPDPPTCTGGTDYTVLSVDSETQLTLTTNFLGTDGPGLTYTISRQFTTLQGWEDCISGAGGCTYFPVVGGDLVVDNRSEVGIAYNDEVGVDFTDNLLISGSTTDPDHNITLTADGGNRHYGIPGDGVVLDPTAVGHAIDVRDDNVRLQWLEVTGWTAGEDGIFVDADSTSYEYLLVHDGGDDSSDGFRLRENTGNWTATVRNSIFYNVGRVCVHVQNFQGTATLVLNLDNVTVHNCGSAGGSRKGGVVACENSVTGNSTTINATNVISVDNIDGDGNGQADFDNSVGNPNCDTATVWGTSDYNLSKDATAPGGNSLPSRDVTDLASPGAPPQGNGWVMFQNLTGGSEDFHLQDNLAQNDALQAGQDLSASFTRDIDDGDRTAPWDIGADEVEATTAVELVSFEALGVDGAVQLRWETGSELDNLGFHLYRSLTEVGPYEQVTASVIPGLGSSPEGAKYAYRDSGLTNGVTYYYQLEDIETTGVTELHGPVSATPTTEVVEEGGSEGEEGSGTEEDLGDLTSRITYGDPSANELKVRRRGKKWMELTLITEGFYAIPQEDGSVLLEVPGFEDFGGPDLPDVPAYRTWQDVLAGRKVKLASVKVAGVAEFASLRPSSSELIVVASGDGTVQTGRRRKKRRRPPHVYYPESWAQLMSVGFQGAAKKALVEMAPLRWDATAESLVLARRIVVRVSFKGKDKAELKLGKSHREVGSHANRSVYARIAVSEPGLYAVSFESVFGKRKKAIKTSALRLSRQGEAVAFFVSPNAKKFKKKSKLYFLSDGADLNPYGPEAVYELEASQQGLRMEALNGSPVGAPITFYWKTVKREENLLYQAAFEGEEDIWQWDWLFGPMTNGYAFEVTNLSPVAENSKLRVWLHGASDFPEDPDHHVRLYMNGTLLTETWWDGETPHFVEAELGPGLLQEGENTLEIEEVGDTEAQYSMVMLDRFEVSYPAQLVAEDGELKGSFSESGVAAVTGAAGQAFDLTESDPMRLAGVSAVPDGLSFRVESGRQYFLTDSVKTPEVRRAQSTGLKKAWSRAEYLVIGPREFLAAAEPLLAHRRNEGLIAGAIATEDIFDEYGYGEATPESIRDFLSYVYHHWSEPALRYVVLLGDGTYDTKDYLATGVESQVPVKILKTQFVWTASDPWYGAINGDDILPDVAIGRLPAASFDEAQQLVAKILAYETGAGEPLAPTVLIADNPDEAGDFDSDAEEIASTILSEETVEKIYLSEMGTAATRSEILNAFDSGASLMSYMGHGAIHLWGNENLLNIWDVDSLSAQAQQPLLLTMNCLNGYFHFPYFNSLSEELLKAEGKGIIAALSPTGLSLNSPAHRFHQALLDHVVNQDHERLGDAILAGQAAYAQTGAFPELLRIYHLLGDPALRLR